MIAQRWPESPWAAKSKVQLAALAKAPRKAILPSRIMTLPGSGDPLVQRRRDGRRHGGDGRHGRHAGRGQRLQRQRQLTDPTTRGDRGSRTEEVSPPRSTRRVVPMRKFPRPTRRGPILVRPACSPRLHGCGYSVRPPFDPGIRTVYVPTFTAITFRRDLNFQLTELVIKEIEKRTPYKVVGSPEGADSTLEGTITFADKNLMVENTNNLPRHVLVMLLVTVKWTDNRTERRQEAILPVVFVNRWPCIPNSARPPRWPTRRRWPRLARDIVNAHGEALVRPSGRSRCTDCPHPWESPAGRSFEGDRRVGHGHPERHARQLLRRRPGRDPVAEALARRRSPDGRGGRPARRRRRIEPARAPSPSAAERSCAG